MNRVTFWLNEVTDMTNDSKSAKAAGDRALLEEVDVAEYTREGKPVPEARVYVISINGKRIKLSAPTITAKEVVEKSGVDQGKSWYVVLKIRGERPRRIKADETIDLREPGIEKFTVHPDDQTEGQGNEA